MNNVLVTGGCGFIGSNFIRYLLSNYDDVRVINVDLLTYAGNQLNLSEYQFDKRYTFVKGDIRDKNILNQIFANHKPTAIIHFAAESHVDRSIKDSMPFVTTNVLGTVNLLEVAKEQKYPVRFLHVSTDEVYGSLDEYAAPFTEKTPYDPRSPYSASKAASDHFVQAYHETFGLDTVMTNCSNNYGPYQHPEKFIPTIITRALNYMKVPVYGNGMNIRDWLYVEDHCAALCAVLHKGKSGEKYNIGGDDPQPNLEIVKTVLHKMKLDISENFEFVEDRKGHDFRYDINSIKIQEELGWKPKVSFDEGIEKTIEWYVKNQNWIRNTLGAR